MHEEELRHPVIVVVGRGQGLEVAEEFGKSFAFQIVLKAVFCSRMTNSRRPLDARLCDRLWSSGRRRRGTDTGVWSGSSGVGWRARGWRWESRHGQAGRRTGICREP